MNLKLLLKVEEFALYWIQQNKKIEALTKTIGELKEAVNAKK